MPLNPLSFQPTLSSMNLLSPEEKHFVGEMFSNELQLRVSKRRLPKCSTTDDTFEYSGRAGIVLHYDVRDIFDKYPLLKIKSFKAKSRIMLSCRRYFLGKKSEKEKQPIQRQGTGGRKRYLTDEQIEHISTVIVDQGDYKTYNGKYCITPKKVKDHISSHISHPNPKLCPSYIDKIRGHLLSNIELVLEMKRGSLTNDSGNEESNSIWELRDTLRGNLQLAQFLKDHELKEPSVLYTVVWSDENTDSSSNEKNKYVLSLSKQMARGMVLIDAPEDSSGFFMAIVGAIFTTRALRNKRNLSEYIDHQDLRVAVVNFMLNNINQRFNSDMTVIEFWFICHVSTHSLSDSNMNTPTRIAKYTEYCNLFLKPDTPADVLCMYCTSIVLNIRISIYGQSFNTPIIHQMWNEERNGINELYTVYLHERKCSDYCAQYSFAVAAAEFNEDSNCCPSNNDFEEGAKALSMTNLTRRDLTFSNLPLSSKVLDNAYMKAAHYQEILQQRHPQSISDIEVLSPVSVSIHHRVVTLPDFDDWQSSLMDNAHTECFQTPFSIIQNNPFPPIMSAELPLSKAVTPLGDELDLDLFDDDLAVLLLVDNTVKRAALSLECDRKPL